MGETADAFVSSEQIPVVLVEGGRLLVAAVSNVSVRPRQAISRPRRLDRWCSTLEDVDLARLLAVIESQLIPRLLGDYSPAKCSALRPGEPGTA